MNLRLISSFVFLAVLAQPAVAANQSHVTRYEELQSRLTLRPGRTFLGFMKEQVKPALDSFDDVIRSDSASRSHNYQLLQKHLIDKGAGVAIRIDDDNYIFNIGYLDGSNVDNDVKSGRSYGVGPTRRQSDPSDVAYLTELERYLRTEPEAAGDFVHALMLVLTNCDTSGWSKLSEDGQIVATDFLAIYTAESDRHLMVNLSARSHPWEIDLAAATFVSVFNVETGLMMKDGTLNKGSIRDWWAKGTTGSGIGNTRRDRIALQRLIAKYDSDPSVVRDLARLTSRSVNDDAIQGLLVYLNSTSSPLEMSASEAEEVSGLMQKYLEHIQLNAHEIAQSVVTE